MMNLNTLSTLGLAALCALGLASSAYAKPGDLADKHFERTGRDGMMCSPKGVLKELQRGKYKCEGAKGADACEASFDAIQGRLDESFTPLFLDLLQTLPADGDTRTTAYAVLCY